MRGDSEGWIRSCFRPHLWGSVALFFTVAAGGFFAVGLLLLKGGDEDGFDVGVGGGESTVLVMTSDLGFDRGGFSDGGEKLVGGELFEGVAAGFAGDAELLEDPLAGIEGEHGVTDPGLGAFVFFSHGWVGIEMEPLRAQRREGTLNAQQ